MVVIEENGRSVQYWTDRPFSSITTARVQGFRVKEGLGRVLFRAIGGEKTRNLALTWLENPEHLMIILSNSFFMQVNIDLVSDKSVNEVALPDGTVVSRSNLSQVVASSCSDLAPLSLRYHLTFPELYDTFNCTP